MDDSGGAGGCAERGRRLDPSAFVFLGVMVLIGSTTATAAKFAVRELPVGLLPMLRFGGAGLCLLPVVWRGGRLRRLVREDGRWLLAAAALCVPINQTFFLNATRLAPTSHVALIYAACPLVVLFLSVALGQERLTWRRLAGVLTCVAGVAVIGLGSFMHGDPTSRDALVGDLLTIGAVASWGGYLTLSKRLIARHGALPALAGVFLTGALLHLSVALITLPTWPPLSSASPAAWRSLAYLILVVSVLGLAFQNQAMRRLDATQVAAVTNIAPLLTVAWGVWLFGEAVTPALAAGGALTLVGVYWCCRPTRRSDPAAPRIADRAQPRTPLQLPAERLLQVRRTGL